MRYFSSRKIIPPLLVVVTLLAGCDLTGLGALPTPRPTATAVSTATAIARPTVLPTDTAVARVVPPAATNTPVQAAAPEATQSPSPVAALTPEAGTRQASCAGMQTGTGDGIGDVLYPQLGNPGYDAAHYTLDLQAD